MTAQDWLRKNFDCELRDADLLTLALSHRSVGKRNNERLEFLGDAVLGHVISEQLYQRFPDADEGQLSRLRVALVKGSVLAGIARELDLGEQLHLGSGELRGGGRRRSSILADSLEAVIGSIAVDQGFEVCRRAILRVFSSRLDQLRPEQAEKDPKTRLQEFLQGHRRPLPRYQVLQATGEEHARTFTVSCSLEDTPEQAEGSGSSLRAAEQAAARLLLERLDAP